MVRYLVEVTDLPETEEVLQGTKLSVDNETGLLEMDNSLVVQDGIAASGHLFAALFCRRVRSVILRKAITLRSCVLIAGKQNN